VWASFVIRHITATNRLNAAPRQASGTRPIVIHTRICSPRDSSMAKTAHANTNTSATLLQATAPKVKKVTSIHLPMKTSERTIGLSSSDRKERRSRSGRSPCPHRNEPGFEPSSGRTSPQVMASVVVLPAPFSPRTPVMNRSGAVREMRIAAGTAPKLLRKCLISIIGIVSPQ
jgi:hypothetical protein